MEEHRLIQWAGRLPDEMHPIKFRKSTARYLLQGFDIDEESRDFLEDMLISGTVPEKEIQELIDIAILAGAQDWYLLVHCAQALRDGRLGPETGTHGLLF